MKRPVKKPNGCRVARLPGAVRQRVNELIRSGAGNDAIRGALGITAPIERPTGVIRAVPGSTQDIQEPVPDPGLSNQHLDWWRGHGYLDWLAEQPPGARALPREALEPPGTSPHPTACEPLPMLEREILSMLGDATAHYRRLVGAMAGADVKVETLSDCGHVVTGVARLRECAMSLERDRLELEMKREERERKRIGEKSTGAVTAETLRQIGELLSLC